MELHEAIIQVLKSNKQPLSACEIADEINKKRIYIPTKGANKGFIKDDLKAKNILQRIGSEKYSNDFVIKISLTKK